MLKSLKGRVRTFLGNLFGQYRESNPVKAAKRSLNPPHIGHTITLWNPSGKSFFGPVGVPTGEYAWVSRQTCRARLRAVMFQTVSQRQPLWSRRTRRRWMRAAASLEYSVMMRDTTNMIPNEKELINAYQ
jgi:hypothetical protein